MMSYTYLHFLLGINNFRCVNTSKKRKITAFIRSSNDEVLLKVQYSHY